MLDDHARLTPERPAIFHQDSIVSFSSLRELSSDLASELVARGAGAGESISLLIPPGLPYLVGVLAIWRIGAVPLIGRATTATQTKPSAGLRIEARVRLERAPQGRSVLDRLGLCIRGRGGGAKISRQIALILERSAPAGRPNRHGFAHDDLLELGAGLRSSLFGLDQAQRVVAFG